MKSARNLSARKSRKTRQATSVGARPKREAALKLKSATASASAQVELRHQYHGKVLCKTDKRGFARPGGRSPLEIVVDASEGFIPLWEKDVTLRWRFQELALARIENPERVKPLVRTLLAKSIALWGKAAPIKFAERDEAWDFEIVVESRSDCDIQGCVLASAFFPDGGQHELTIYPTMFEQEEAEQVETMAHELGHVFGLRHFFAQVSESAWPSEIFGAHSPFSIMNYGSKSTMTDHDRSDLAQLYQGVWSGAIRHINGTPIRLFRPFSASRFQSVGQVRPAAQCPCCGFAQVP